MKLDWREALLGLCVLSACAPKGEDEAAVGGDAGAGGQDASEQDARPSPDPDAAPEPEPDLSVDAEAPPDGSEPDAARPDAAPDAAVDAATDAAVTISVTEVTLLWTGGPAGTGALDDGAPVAVVAGDLTGDLHPIQVSVGAQAVIDAQGAYVGPQPPPPEFPLRADTDGDGFIDWLELVCGTDPQRVEDHPRDLDGDRIPDVLEARNALAGDAFFAPPNKPYLGRSYGSWAAGFWPWVASLPGGAGHPLFDERGVDCGNGQSGPVWYLGGLLGSAGGGVAERTCQVPQGTALFAPIVNYFCAISPGDPYTLASLRGCAHGGLATAESYSVTVDGIPFDEEALAPYLVETPVFDLGPMIGGNPFTDEPGGLAGASFPAVDAGYYVMLRPLPRGLHTLSLRAFIPDALDLAVDYVLDVR